MSDTQSIEEPTPEGQIRQLIIKQVEEEMPIICSIWRNTLFRIVPDGLEVRCKSCRGAIHHISRARIEQTWSELKQSVTTPHA